MKYMAPMLMLLFICATSCSREEDVLNQDDELTIEREEEYRGSETREPNRLPRKMDELDLERD